MAVRLDGGCGYAGSSAMATVRWAAASGDVGEVERLVGQDPDLLDAKDAYGFTPLMLASAEGRVEVVRWLIDHGAAINEWNERGNTALYLACLRGQSPVVRLLVGRGADPAIAAPRYGLIPLFTASHQGHLEVVRSLLGHPSADTTVNHRDVTGRTALWYACAYGRGGVVRALLESGADPTIGTNSGIPPMVIAKHDGDYPNGVTAADRRDCVVALEVRATPLHLPRDQLVQGVFCVLGRGGRMRSGPTCSGRPGGWRMRLGASRRRRWWNRGREARPIIVVWRQCRRS
jgi:uncharacterized protein